MWPFPDQILGGTGCEGLALVGPFAAEWLASTQKGQIAGAVVATEIGRASCRERV